MDKGTLYGVSVGPGEAELLTLKALRILNACPVVAAPRTQGGAMVALDIIRPVVDLADKEVLPLEFTMSGDEAKRAAAHDEAAVLLRTRLDAGQDVAVLNLGDVSLYASFQYLAQRLRGQYTIRMVPGVPSFCAAAATLGISLTEMAKPLHLIPAGQPGENAVTVDGTCVYMKSGRQLGVLLDELERVSFLGKTMLVQNCGMEDERIFCGTEAKQAPNSYFSIVIVKE